MPEQDTEVTTETAPEPESAPASTEPDPNAPPILEDAPDLTVEEIFNFNPFGPDGTPNVPESEQVDEATGEQIVETPVEVAPEPVAPVGAVPDPLQARLAAIEAREQQVMEMLSRMQAPVAPVAPAAPTPPKDDLPNYMFEIPQQIREMLASEDAAVQHRGLAALNAGVARVVHEQLRTEYRQHLGQEIQRFREQFISDQQRAQQAQAVFQDFYGTYPQFNRPELRGVIESATKAVVAEEKASAWSAALRDKIGARVVQIISSVSPASQQAEPVGGQIPKQTPTQPSARRPAPPKMRGVSSRPAQEAPPEPGSQEAHMMEVLRGSN